ncbi:hypothetical protein JKG47_18930 [Acidithiobacillus sp. MC6.1]|nr:hypothetical protein [Acidithiobacillus sp. MC6.1]
MEQMLVGRAIHPNIAQATFWSWLHSVLVVLLRRVISVPTPTGYEPVGRRFDSVRAHHVK